MSKMGATCTILSTTVSVDPLPCFWFVSISHSRFYNRGLVTYDIMFCNNWLCHVISYKYCQEYIKEAEGECQTTYMLHVIAIRTIHDLCNDIHVWRSP